MLPEISVFALPAGWGPQSDRIGPFSSMSGAGISNEHACTTLWTG